MNEIETEIEIDLKSGDVFLNRDHEFMVKLAELLSPDEYQSFQDFFNSKPEDHQGNKNYNSFCG